MALHVESLTVEHLKEPLAIGNPRPRLSWTVDGTEGSLQHGYQVSITGSGRPDFVTGTVQRQDSTFQPWPGTPLTSRERVDVCVRVCDESGRFSEWSAPTIIEASLLRRADWNEPFVSPSLQAEPGVFRPAYLLRAEFDVPVGIIAARIYASAHGVYEFEVNSERVGKTVLDPGWTSYRHRIRQQSYDIRSHLRTGRNADRGVVGRRLVSRAARVQRRAVGHLWQRRLPADAAGVDPGGRRHRARPAARQVEIRYWADHRRRHLRRRDLRLTPLSRWLEHSRDSMTAGGGDRCRCRSSRSRPRWNAPPAPV